MHRQHRKSGGACFAAWQESTPEGLYFRMLQLVCELMMWEGISAAVVHEAFKVVPEYRLTLPYHRPDALSENEEELVEMPLPNFGRGYPQVG